MSGGACSDDRPLLSEPPNPMPAAIPVENWLEAERVVRGVVWRIRPTNRSEERRREVVGYVQGVIRSRLGSEVFPFGSVPLKTYLPDGDIDLTALAPSNIEESLAVNVRALLEEEERRNCTTFEVRDVQYIHAEVKLVKCLVQNIVVDISFNQVGGLCTLCFLEQVDNLIGKDHLFKRSIILIKAWCYYESRILGAHHGLISTYALETLILYIFHLFHSSLDGPIAVLYRFLEYFSKFDWDKFCISLRGPVPISSLPEILAEVPTVPEVDGGDLLLSPEFLDRCVDLFSAPHRVPENNRVFAKKYLNIVDPLKEYNNLGRSVSKGNLYRIRSAFAYGARKLGQILLHRECMRDELDKFFKNTLERHGEGQRPDVQGDYNDFSDKGIPSLNSQNGNSFDKLGSLTISQSHNIVYDKSQSRLYENGMGLEVHQASELQDEDHFKEQYLQPCSHVKREKSKDSKENLASLAGDSTNAPGTCEKFNPRVTASTCEYSTTRSDKGAVAVTGNRINHAPHLFFSHSNGSDMASSGASDKSPMHSEACIDIVDVEAHWQGSTAVTDEQGSTPDAYDLANLSGEHERHLKNLQYSQWCHEYFLNGCVSSGKQFFSPSLLNKQQWDAISQRDIFRNGLVQSSPFSRVLNYYQMGPNLVSGSYNMEESLKPRGTGMYLTNMNYKMYRDPAESPGKGRNMFSTIPGPRFRNSGPTMTYSETYSADLSGHDRTQHQVNESAPARDLFVNVMSPVKRNSPLEVQGTSGGVGPAPSNNPSLIPGKLESEDVQGPSATSPAQQPLESPSYRRSGKSYRLKDDDEFPPLSNKGQHQSRTVWEVRK